MPRDFVGVRIDTEDIQKIDRIIQTSKKYKNRSEIIRKAIKDFLNKN